MRRLTHHAYNPHVVDNYASVQESEALRLVQKLNCSSTDVVKSLRESMGRVAWRSVYSGYTSYDVDFAVIARMEQIVRDFVLACAPAAYVVDAFPWLKALPNWLSPGKREGTMYFEKTDRFFRSLLTDMKEAEVGSMRQPGKRVELIRH